MNNIIAVNSNTYHGFSLLEALEGIKSAGFKYVELTASRGWTEHVDSKMSDEKINEIKKQLKNHDITPIGLSGHCNLMDTERLDDFVENIKLAKKFNCKYIITSVGEAHFGVNEVFNDDILVKNLTEICKVCESEDIILAIENHGEHSTGKIIKDIIDKVDSNKIGVNYDTANVVFYGNQMPEDEILSCINDVKYVHIKDKAGKANEWNFPALGKGELNLPKVINLLTDSGYTAPYSIEIEFNEAFTMNEKKEGDLEIVHKAVKDSYEYLQSLNMI